MKKLGRQNASDRGDDDDDDDGDDGDGIIDENERVQDSTFADSKAVTTSLLKAKSAAVKVLVTDCSADDATSFPTVDLGDGRD